MASYSLFEQKIYQAQEQCPRDIVIRSGNNKALNSNMHSLLVYRTSRKY
jgi:hypothetical protein